MQFYYYYYYYFYLSKTRQIVTPNLIPNTHSYIAIVQRTYSVSIYAKGFIGKSYEGRIWLCFKCVFIAF